MYIHCVIYMSKTPRDENAAIPETPTGSKINWKGRIQCFHFSRNLHSQDSNMSNFT